MRVSQLGVVVSTRGTTGAVPDGQLAEIKLEFGLSHLDDDGGCRVLASDGGWFWEAETRNSLRGVNKSGSHRSPSTLVVAERFNSTNFPLNNFRGRWLS